MFVRVFPYTTDVFAPPYTFLPMLAPTMFTLLSELLLSIVPVAAWFPPPNTLPVILVEVPSTVALAFW